MKSGTIRLTDVAKYGRMDAGFHLYRVKHSESFEKLRKVAGNPNSEAGKAWLQKLRGMIHQIPEHNVEALKAIAHGAMRRSAAQMIDNMTLDEATLYLVVIMRDDCGKSLETQASNILAAAEKLVRGLQQINKNLKDIIYAETENSPEQKLAADSGDVSDAGPAEQST